MATVPRTRRMRTLWSRSDRVLSTGDTTLARIGVVPLGCAIGLVLLIGAGGLTWHTSPSYGHEPKTVGTRDVGVIPTATPTATPPANLALSPTRIEIPKLHAEAPIVKVATTPDGELDVPQNPRTVGWWSPGARPGAAVGTAILAGHINYAGVQGAMGRIGDLSRGDTFTIDGTSINSGGRKSLTFTVTGVRTYHKTRLPYQQIFDQKSIGRVALVTCGGPFDNATGNYLDNIVVFGVVQNA